MKKHIGIIGAGFVGLTTALELHDRDYKVTVLEARQRVGGRVWSTRLSNGEITELGGEWINGKDKQVLGMIDRLKLSKTGVGVNFLERKVIAGSTVSFAEKAAAIELAAKTLAAMPEEDIASRTIGDFINHLPLSVSQKKYFYSRLQISYGIDLKNVALRMMKVYTPAAQTSIKENDLYYRSTSGNMSLAQTIADSLEDVRLGHEAWLVENTERSVIIKGTSADGPFQLELDGVVIAVPVKILAELEFNPPLPLPIKNAIGSVSMGAAARITVATKTRPTLRAYHDVETPYWCWTGKGSDGKVRKVLTAFSGSTPALKKLATESNNPSVWFTELKSANPDLDFEGAPIMVDWSNDKWARGCYSAFSNQAADQIPHLTKSVGRIFFAGEHTAYQSATMEGAIESGLRAAQQVIDELSEEINEELR
jgi:monoamine oxidase